MAKRKVEATRVYRCNVCKEMTACGRGMLSSGKIGPKAPAYCAACGSPDLTSLYLHAALPEGFHLVKCPGDAHSNLHIDHCGLCMGGPWGLVRVPVEFASVEEYREAQYDKAGG